jgi:WD40-like Beta Propeller Repeat
MKRLFKHLLSSSIALTVLLCSSSLAQNVSLVGIPLNVVETPHFSIVFSPKLGETYARRIGAAAEAIRDGVIQLVGSDPGHTIIMLSDDSDAVNGFTNPSPRSRMKLWTSFPRIDTEFGVQWQDWLRTLITHEFTHAAHLSRRTNSFNLINVDFDRGSPSLFGSAIGEGNKLATVAPPWFTEGFATYAETKLTSGGRGRDASVLTQRAQAALNGHFPSYGEISSGRFQRTGNQYTYGVGFVQFLLEKYGETTAHKVIEHYERQAFPFDFSSAWQEVTGSHLQPLYDEWTKLELARANKNLEALQNTALPQGSILIRNSPKLISSTWDAQSLIFTSGVKIYKADNGDTSNARVLTSLPFAADRVSLANDSSIVYSRLTFSGSSTSPSEVFRWHNGTEQRLTNNAHARYAIADGDCVLYVKDYLETSSLHRICNSKDTEILAAPTNWHFAQPAPGPNNTIALSVWRPGGFLDIATIKRNPNGTLSPLEFVTSDHAQDGWASWTPNGTLLWSSDRNGSFQLFKQDGKDIKQLTANPGGAYSSSTNANGQTLFASFGMTQFDLHKIETLPEGTSVSLERTEPQGFNDTGLEYSVASYMPNLAPVAWSIISLQGVTSVGVSLLGNDAANLMTYNLFAGYASVNDRTGFGTGLALKYDPTPDFGISLTSAVGFFDSNSSGKFNFGYSVNTQINFQGGFELLGASTAWFVTPFAQIDERGVDSIHAGVVMTLSTGTRDPFRYRLSGWTLSGSATARGAYNVNFTLAGAPLWNIPLILTVNANANPSPARTGTVGYIEVASRFSVEIGLRPNGFMLERLTFQPFVFISEIGFGGVYGGGIRILTDVVVGYYAPLSIGIELGYYSTGQFKFGLALPR